MMRHCDGTDPNLTMYLTPDGERTVERVSRERARPCDCGLRFDDVERMTIYPHHLVHAQIVVDIGGGAWLESAFSKLQADSARFGGRAEQAEAERDRLRVQIEAALRVIHEWQRDGEPNDYLTRVHRALNPPVSGVSAAIPEGGRSRDDGT